MSARQASSVVVFLLAALRVNASASTLATIQARHTLHCAVVTEAADWNREDLHGNLAPLGEAICRAVAVAVLGPDGGLLVSHAPSEADALIALRTSQADVAVGVTPATSTGLRLGVTFGPPVFWDALSVMVHRGAGIRDLAGLAGRTVCYIDGTDTAGVLLATLKARGIAVRPFPFQEEGEMDAAFTGSHCQAMSAYASKLAGKRAQFQGGEGFVLLPDRLGLSPESVATRAGDAGWSAVVAATVDALVQAEMLGVTSASVAQAARSDDPVLKRLLGADWSSALALGLPHDWSAKMLGAVGNYGEVYARTLGEGSAMRLPAGVNLDCLHGGVLCAAGLR